MSGECWSAHSEVFHGLLWLLEVPGRIIEIRLQVTEMFLQEILPHTVMLLELTYFCELSAAWHL